MTPEEKDLIREGLELCPCEGKGPCDAWGCQEIRTLQAEIERLEALIAALRLQMEDRDQSAYVLMQNGMESQAELMDGMKQELRQLRADHIQLVKELE